jgi:hypothetical protein
MRYSDPPTKETYWLKKGAEISHQNNGVSDPPRVSGFVARGQEIHSVQIFFVQFALSQKKLG